MLSLSHIKKSPRYTMRQREKTLPPFDGPGPGAYSLHSPEHTSRCRSGPHFAFGTAGRDAVFEKKVPGPGAYSLPQTIGKEGVAYSHSPRRKNPQLSGSADVPGPGAHDIRSRLGEGPKFTVSHRGDHPEKDSGPGPVDYDAVDKAIAEGKPQWGFGTQHRMDAVGKGQMATPGPGAYIVSTVVGEGPKYSMKSRYGNPRPYPSPGPGAHGGHYSSFN